MIVIQSYRLNLNNNFNQFQRTTMHNTSQSQRPWKPKKPIFFYFQIRVEYFTYLTKFKAIVTKPPIASPENHIRLQSTTIL